MCQRAGEFFWFPYFLYQLLIISILRRLESGHFLRHIPIFASGYLPMSFPVLFVPFVVVSFCYFYWWGCWRVVVGLWGALGAGFSFYPF